MAVSKSYEREIYLRLISPPAVKRLHVAAHMGHVIHGCPMCEQYIAGILAMLDGVK